MSETVYSNPFFRVVKNGPMHHVEESGGDNNAVVLVRLEDAFAFIKTHRPANDGMFIEAPRGGAELDETGVACAIRELCEETGISLHPDELIQIGVVYPNTGMMRSKADVFVAPVSRPLISMDGAGTEQMLVVADSQIEHMVASGAIVDGFTLSALALYMCRESGCSNV